MSQYFTPGIAAEQDIREDLIVEAIDFMSTDIYYVPRTLVHVDSIFTEDRFSEFKNKYKIRGYLDQVDSFGGQGAFIAKFGLQIEQTATFTVARKVWNDAVGKYGQTILSSRPTEGDLIYWPTNGGLFEIKFVNYQNPFYQLGKLYVYKLEVELYQYASERISTGMPAIDVFEDLKSHSTEITANPTPVVPQLPATAGDNAKFVAAAPTIGFNSTNVFGDIQ